MKKCEHLLLFRLLTSDCCVKVQGFSYVLVIVFRVLHSPESGNLIKVVCGFVGISGITGPPANIRSLPGSTEAAPSGAMSVPLHHEDFLQNKLLIICSC